MSRWRFGACVVDEAAATLTRNGETIPLSRSPFLMLLHFLRHPQVVQTKAELFDALWPGRVVVESALTVCVKKLRHAIGDDEGNILVTVHRVGYRFAADVACEERSHPVNAWNPEVGRAVPGREHWHLQQHCGVSKQRGLWIAQHDKSLEKRAFKFATPVERVSVLKNELTIQRLLNRALPNSQAFARLLEWRLDEPPYWLEFEALTGTDLRALLQMWRTDPAHAPPRERRLAIIAALAEALASAHSIGVLHRDLSPANVWVAEPDSAHVVLTDFGSGSLDNQDLVRGLGITLAGDAAADSTTPLYTAPEILQGAAPTTRSDVYALGVILLQTLVGDERATLDPGWEDRIGDELLCEDIRLCCHQDSRQRLGDALELASRLRSLPDRHAQRANERNVLAENARLKELERDTRERLTLMRQRRRWLVLVLGIVLLAAILATGFAIEAARERNAAKLAEADAIKHQEISDAVSRYFVHATAGAANPYAVGQKDMTVREMLQASSEKVHETVGDVPEVEMIVRSELSNAFASFADFTRATEQAELGLAIAKRENHPKRWSFETHLADIDRLQWRIGQANRRIAAALAQPDLPPLPEEYLRAMHADLLFDVGRYGDSMSQIDKVLAMVDKREELNSSLRNGMELLRGRALLELGRVGEAEAVFAAILRRGELAKLEWKGDPSRAGRRGMAMLRWRTGDLDQAIEQFGVLVDELKSGFGEGSRLHLGNALLLTEILLDDGRCSDAERELAEIAAFERDLIPRASYWDIKLRLAALRRDRAALSRQLTEAEQRIGASYGGDALPILKIAAHRVRSTATEGRLDQAIAELDRAILSAARLGLEQAPPGDKLRYMRAELVGDASEIARIRQRIVGWYGAKAPELRPVQCRS